MLRYHCIVLFGIFIVAAFLPFKANAQEELERYTAVKIIPHQEENRSYTLATEITLAPHWHVYWSNPGDSGLPVKITWDLPDGFEVSDVAWPTPDKISYDILANYGYYDRVTLLQNVTVPKGFGDVVTLSATVDMLVCNEICIPETQDVSLTLHGGEDNGIAIEKARAKMPQPLDGSYYFTEWDGLLSMSLQPDNMHDFVAQADKIEFFPYDWGVLSHVDTPVIDILDDVVSLTHKRGDEALDMNAGLGGLLVIKGEYGQSVGFDILARYDPKILDDVSQHTENSVAPDSLSVDDVETHDANQQELTFVMAMIFALLGGVVLNLMPCVFPVLSMKALSLVKMSEKEQKHARLHGMAYTFGVVLSFAAIGGALLLLKAIGYGVGWGFQLQNPIVVALLAYLLFAVGLNLIGFLNLSFGFGNVGHHLTQKQGVSGSFFTGALAALVAAPCTAPFMGAALGFALTQSAFVSMSIFVTLGFGLALPYLLLSYIPALRQFLPKPGAWMDTFKQFLAFPMFASAIWLVWVLSQQAGDIGVLIVLLGMLSFSFALWMVYRGFQGFLSKTLMIVMFAAPVYALFYVPPAVSTEMKVANIKENSHIFSPEGLDVLLDGDDPVFVEMTASWCITCKFNHATSINVRATQALFAKHGVQYVVGDWTNRDDDITVYLHQFKRNGVPLYVYYAVPDTKTGERPDPVLLPQILTPAIVQSYIE